MQTLQLLNVDQALVSLAPNAEGERDKLVAQAKDITGIADELDFAVAADVLRQLSTLRKSVEDTRAEVKKPVLNLGRQIDGLAASFAGPVETEARRINSLIANYMAVQQRKADEAERERQRLAREAEQKETERRAADAEFLGADAPARPALLPPPVVLPQPGPPAVIVPKAAGLAVGDVWRFEVTDIHALYAANRGLVRIEPNAQAINTAMRDGMRTCPGLRIWNETRATMRT
jgi:hypothetical protein